MSYENPQVPHDVNVSRESTVVEFLRLAAGVGVVALLLAAVLYLFGGSLARLVPFSMERDWTGDRVLAPFGGAEATCAEALRVEAYLQQLADALAARMDLPPGMQPRVHWADTAVPNAFATLGGHIVVTRGLYERLPSENALAMVVAHEIAHVRARDPLAAVGGSASLAVVLAVLGGSADQLVPHLAHAVQLGYSRRAERRADTAALAAIVARYGHAGGVAAVFEVLQASRGAGSLAEPTLLSTHPADADRIDRLRRAAAAWDPVRQPLRRVAVPWSPAEQAACGKPAPLLEKTPRGA